MKRHLYPWVVLISLAGLTLLPACGKKWRVPPTGPKPPSPTATPTPKVPTPIPTATPVVESGCFMPPTVPIPGEIDFFCLMMGPTPFPTEPKRVIRSQADWEGYWAEVNAYRACKNQPPLPLPPAPVDFAVQMVVLQMRSANGCGNLNLVNACVGDGKITMNLDDPMPPCATVRCSGSTYHPVGYVFNQSNLPVEWVTQDNCPPSPLPAEPVCGFTPLPPSLCVNGYQEPEVKRVIRDLNGLINAYPCVRIISPSVDFNTTMILFYAKEVDFFYYSGFAGPAPVSSHTVRFESVCRYSDRIEVKVNLVKNGLFPETLPPQYPPSAYGRAYVGASVSMETTGLPVVWTVTEVIPPNPFPPGI